MTFLQIDRAGPDDPPAIDSLYREQWAPLVRLSRLLVDSHAVAEELAQEAFIGLLRSGDSVREPKAYLRRSVVNLAVNAGRRATHERAYVRTLTEGTQLPPEIDETWQALALLPARQRAALVLRYYEDLSEAEIARALDCRPGTVKSLTARGLARLREELPR